jgi:hypothetical protein
MMDGFVTTRRKGPCFHTLAAGLGIMVAGLTAAPLEASLAVYAAFKGEHYIQAGSGAPGVGERDAFGIQAFARAAAGPAPFVILVQSGGAISIPLVMQPLEGRPDWVAEQPFETASARDDSFPEGALRFQVLDLTGGSEATLTLATPALPPVPAVSNHTETQVIDPDQAFTLRWNSFAGAEPQDVIWVQVKSREESIFSTPIPGAPGALPGSASEVVLPAGLLRGQASIKAVITFVKVGRQAAGSIPGSTALTGSYRQTTLDLKLKGGGGPVSGPVLLLVTPPNGWTDVLRDGPVRFVFNRPMAPVVDMLWLANGLELSGDSFSYSWSADGTTLVATCRPGFPPNASITWFAGTGFKDTSGGALTGDLKSGFFMTSRDLDDCDDGGLLGESGTFSLSRVLRFSQSSAGVVAPHPDGGAFLIAGFTPPEGLNVSGASFTPPSRPLVSLERFFGTPLFFIDVFDDVEELDDAYPQGSYLARVEPVTGSPIQMTVSATGAYPPTPEWLNHDAALTIDPAASVTLTWKPFTGADANSLINVEITDEEDDVIFSAPNECEMITLAPTATGIAVPAGTLQAGRTYNATLSFNRITDTREHSASGIRFLTAQGATTETTLRTLGGTPVTTLRFGDVSISANNRFRGTLTGAAGAAVLVESSSDMIAWRPVTTLTLGGTGTAMFEDPRPLNENHQQFYRARVP